MKALKQIEQMQGKTFSYANRIHYVIGFTHDEQREKITIKTNIGEYERTYEAMPEFLGYWKEFSTTSELQPGNDNRMPAVYESEKTNVDKLTELLMENIKKVQTDPSYIKQATTINNNVNSIINLTKLKLDVIKQSKKGF